MSALRINAGGFDLRMDVTDGDEAVSSLLEKIAQDFREQGGFWLEAGRFQQLSQGDSDGSALDDLIWCPAASTVVNATFDHTVPDGALRLSVTRPR